MATTAAGLHKNLNIYRPYALVSSPIDIQSIHRGYDFIWFCKDVEQVYIGKRVDNSQKKNESTKFKKNNLITKVDVHRLSGRDYRIKTSNIMTVLDSYQELKRK